MNYIMTDSEFNNIPDQTDRIMLHNAYKAICAAEAWDWLRNFNEPSFTWSSDPMIITISKNMKRLGYNGHSGTSFGCAMRSMEILAKHGKDEFFNRSRI